LFRYLIIYSSPVFLRHATLPLFFFYVDYAMPPCLRHAAEYNMLTPDDIDFHTPR